MLLILYCMPPSGSAGAAGAIACHHDINSPDPVMQLLGRFGTDFQTMEKLISGRTRAQLKGKYRRECKLDAERIDLALKGQASPLDPLLNLHGCEAKACVWLLAFSALLVQWMTSATSSPAYKFPTL